jgi:hypothetical protein
LLFLRRKTGYAAPSEKRIAAIPGMSILLDWQELLFGKSSDQEYEILKSHGRTGRPLGSAPLIE